MVGDELGRGRGGRRIEGGGAIGGEGWEGGEEGGGVRREDEVGQRQQCTCKVQNWVWAMVIFLDVRNVYRSYHPLNQSWALLTCPPRHRVSSSPPLSGQASGRPQRHYHRHHSAQEQGARAGEILPLPHPLVCRAHGFILCRRHRDRERRH